MSDDQKMTLESISNLLDKLAEHSASVYWLSTPDLQQIKYVSSAYEIIWGRPRAELYKNPSAWLSYLHPDDVKDYKPINSMVQSIATKGAQARYDESYRIIRPNGEVRWIIDRGFPIYDDKGKCCGIVGVAIDITREKQVEEKLYARQESLTPVYEASMDNLPKILGIEDDPILQIATRNIFESSQCKLITAANVKSGCEALAKEKFDLILCDIGLEDGSGLEILKWALATKNHPNQHTPFVILTADTSNEVRVKALHLGAKQVLQKPLTKEKTESLLNDYIRKQQRPISTTANIFDIIDILATAEIAGDDKSAREILAMLYANLPADKKQLKEFYEQNNIIKTQEILHRLDGTFRHCIVPRLQRARTALQEAARHTQRLSDLDKLYDDFYNEVDAYLRVYQDKFQKRILTPDSSS